MILGFDSMMIPRENISIPSVRIEEISGLSITQGEGEGKEGNEQEKQGGEGPNMTAKRDLGGLCTGGSNQPLKKSKSERNPN